MKKVKPTMCERKSDSNPLFERDEILKFVCSNFFVIVIEFSEFWWFTFLFLSVIDGWWGWCLKVNWMKLQQKIWNYPSGLAARRGTASSPHGKIMIDYIFKRFIKIISNCFVPSYSK